MKTLLAIFLALGLLATLGLAQPAITQVQNAASNAVPPLANAPIAPGSYFSIYGTNIGPTTFAYWNPYPLPTTLSGVSIAVTVGGTTVAAYPEFVYATQINAVLPETTPSGAATITVTYNGATSAPFSFTVVPMSFGAFTLNQAGSGPGIFQNAVTYANVTPFSTVKPGDYVTVYGTGLGAAGAQPGGEQSGPPVGVNLCGGGSSCPVTVWVGGVQASVQYAGRSGYTAEDEVVFIMPTNGANQGCYVQVAVQTSSGASTVVGNFTSISVDPNGPTCSDADGINYGDLATAVNSKGSANVGAISLLSNFLDITTLGVQWDNDTVNAEIGTLTQPVLNLFQGFSLAPSANNCTVQQFFKYPPPTDPGLGYISYLDAGSQLSITGPNGTQPVPKNANGKGYSNLVGGETISQLILGGGNPPFYLNSSDQISAGTYTVTGTGGPDVGALSASVTTTSAAAGFKWTNSSISSSPISRSAPLTINWTGGDSNGYVDITAIASTLSGSAEFPSATTPGILIECIAPASAGTFQIPEYVLQALPSTVGSQSLTPPGELLVGPSSVSCSSTIATSTSCPADLTLPSGLDALYIFYHFIAGANVTWQ